MTVFSCAAFPSTRDRAGRFLAGRKVGGAMKKFAGGTEKRTRKE